MAVARESGNFSSYFPGFLVVIILTVVLYCALRIFGLLSFCIFLDWIYPYFIFNFGLGIST
jgi:hypothetical protein